MNTKYFFGIAICLVFALGFGAALHLSASHSYHKETVKRELSDKKEDGKNP